MHYLTKIKSLYNYINGVYVPKQKVNNYARNFGYQWRDFSRTQIDQYNKSRISKKFIDNITFHEIKSFKDKLVLEIGCGPGRFSEYLQKYSKKLFLVDLSDAIFYNHYKSKKNVIAVKDNFSNLFKLKIKFDVIVCRGVLQHTPKPLESIIQMKKLLNKSGHIYFDIYKPPMLGPLNSKYLWRHIIKIFNVSYDNLFNFLSKNCKSFLYYRRKLNNFFNLNLNFLWDYIFPIYDYKGKLPLNNKQLEEWAIMDTLDGLLAKYDKPYDYKAISYFLKNKSIKIKKFNEKLNCYKI